MGCCTGNNNAHPRSQPVPVYRSTDNRPLPAPEPVKQRVITTIDQPRCPVCKHMVRAVNIAGNTVIQCVKCGHKL